MRGRAALAYAVALLLTCATEVVAQTKPPRPQIPSSELPGRERERFVDKFPPPKAATPPVISVYDATKPKSKRKRRTSKTQ